MGFKEYLKLYQKLTKEYKSFDEKTEDGNRKKHYWGFKRDDCVSKFYDNLLNGFEPEKLLNEVSKRIPKNYYESYVFSLVKTFSSGANIKHLLSNPKVYPDIDKKMPPEQRLTIFNECYSEALKNHPEKKALFDKLIKSAYKVWIKANLHIIKDESKLGEFLSVFGFKNEAELDKFIPDTSFLVTGYENPELENEYPFKDKIETLKSQTNDAEYKKILDDANDILVLLKEEYKNLSGSVGEKIGNEIGEGRIQELKNSLVKEGYKENQIETSRAQIYFHIEERTYDNRKALYDSLKHPKPSNEQQKKEIKYILKLMVDSGIFKPSVFLAEHKTKEYGFRELMKIKENLGKAVNANNPEDIKKYQKQYRDLEKLYDQIIKRLEKINDNNYFAANVSPARVREVPAKYRHKVIAASRLSALWLTLGFCSANNFDYKKMVDDPMGSLEKIAIENFKNNVFLEETKKDAGDLKTLISELPKGYESKYYIPVKTVEAIADGYERATRGVIACLDRKDQDELLIEYFKYRGSNVDIINNALSASPNYYFSEEPLKTVAYMIMCPRKDFNLYFINPKHNQDMNPLTKDGTLLFNAFASYKKNKNNREILENMINLLDIGPLLIKEIKEDLAPNITRACSAVSDLCLKQRVKKLPAERNLFNIFQNGKIPTKEDIFAFKIEGAKNAKYNNVEMEEIFEAYHSFKSKYDNSFFLKRWFSKSTKALNGMANELKEALVYNGLSERLIDERYKNYIPKQRLVNPVEEEEHEAPKNIVIKEAKDINNIKSGDFTNENSDVNQMTETK